MDTYPNDPHINDSMEPYGWGQLTNVNTLLFKMKLSYKSDLTVIQIKLERKKEPVRSRIVPAETLR